MSEAPKINSAKFGFSNDFGTGGSTTPFVERRKDLSIGLEQHQNAMKEAEAQAYMRGHCAGVEAARLEQTARLATATQHLTEILLRHRHHLAVIESQAHTESLGFAFQFATLLAGSLIKDNPLAPIEAAARHVFDDLRGAPHIAVRVSSNLVTSVKDMLSRIALDIGLQAKIIVLGEPDIEQSDCRIEWADGGIISDQTALQAQIKKAIAGALVQAGQYNTIKQKDFSHD